MKNKNTYENSNNEGEGNEGWVALWVCLFVGFCIILVLWEPNAEGIGERVSSYLQSF